MVQVNQKRVNQLGQKGLAKFDALVAGGDAAAAKEFLRSKTTAPTGPRVATTLGQGLTAPPPTAETPVTPTIPTNGYFGGGGTPTPQGGFPAGGNAPFGAIPATPTPQGPPASPVPTPQGTPTGAIPASPSLDDIFGIGTGGAADPTVPQGLTPEQTLETVRQSSDLFSADKQRLYTDILDQFERRNSKIFQDQEQQLEQQLLNRGVPQGSELHSKLIQQLRQEQQDQRLDAQSRALQLSGEEQSRLFDLGRPERLQGQDIASQFGLQARNIAAQYGLSDKETDRLLKLQGGEQAFQREQQLNDQWFQRTENEKARGHDVVLANLQGDINLRLTKAQNDFLAAEAAKDRGLSWKLAKHTARTQREIAQIQKAGSGDAFALEQLRQEGRKELLQQQLDAQLESDLKSGKEQGSIF